MGKDTISNQSDPQPFYFLQQDNFLLFISLGVLYLCCESHFHLEVPTVIVLSACG